MEHGIMQNILLRAFAVWGIVMAFSLLYPYPIHWRIDDSKLIKVTTWAIPAIGYFVSGALAAYLFQDKQDWAWSFVGGLMGAAILYWAIGAETADGEWKPIFRASCLVPILAMPIGDFLCRKCFKGKVEQSSETKPE